MKKKYILILILLLSPIVLRAQTSDSLFTPKNILIFANYLFQEGDYLRAAMEYERYLYLSQSDDDTVNFKLGLAHQLRERPDFAAVAFMRIAKKPASALRKSARLAVLYNYALMGDWQRILNFGYESDEEFYFRYLADMSSGHGKFTNSYFAELQEEYWRQQLMVLEQERQHLKHKSPLLAGFLSAVVPGLGKAYIKRWGDALYAFAATGATAFITYEAFDSNREITGVITGGMSLSFYFGTIYGSYLGTQLYNAQVYQTWLERLKELSPVNLSPYWLPWVSAK